MDPSIHPECFGADPNAADTTESWTRCDCTFVNFLETFEHLQLNKLRTLFNYPPPVGYRDQDLAASTFQSWYAEQKNKVCPASTNESQTGESTEQFPHKPCTLGDRNYQAGTAEQHEGDSSRHIYSMDKVQHYPVDYWSGNHLNSNSRPI